MVSKRRAPVEERFWRNVHKGGPDECWPFGSGEFRGYRTIALGSRADGTIMAHKFSYQLHHGPVPTGMVVMHSCDNPPCCNPAHLSLGSYADNAADMHEKGRAARQGPCGEHNPNVKLTEELVRYIRANPQRGHKDLADELGLTPNTVRGVRIGRTWKHVT